MNGQPSQSDIELWKRYMAAWEDLGDAQVAFFQKCQARVHFIKTELRSGREKAIALEAAARLPIKERKELLSELLQLGVSARYLTRCHELILALPHDWLVSHIEECAAELLSDDTDDDAWRQTLGLYRKIDRDLTIRLVRRAAAHSNPDIQDLGREELEDWGETLDGGAGSSEGADSHREANGGNLS